MKPQNPKSGVEDLVIAEQTVAVNVLGTFRITAVFMPLLLSQPQATVMTVCRLQWL